MRKSLDCLITSALIFCLFIAVPSLAATKDIKLSVACDYLASVGLAADGWKHYWDDNYGCCSPYKEFGAGFPKNNIAYYVNGTATTVKQLELVVNVHNRAEAKKAHNVLLEYAKILLKKSLNEPLPDNICDAITNGTNMSSKIGDTAVIEIIREDWPTGKGYEMKFVINLNS